MDKILLIDGHSILHRAFYGLPLLANSNGIYTNAVYGFLNMFFNVLEEDKPNYVAVAFDSHAKTFRHEFFPEYKAGRKPTPTELISQVDIIKEVLTAMNIPILQKPGLEADDILGTIATRAKKKGFEAEIFSGDRDLLQIADDTITIRIPKTKKTGNVTEIYRFDDVLEVLGVTPKQFISVKALMGDTSDNIPGLPKVGEKTATELIQKYDSIDGIYQNIDSIEKLPLKQKLIDNKDLAYTCLKLATIVTDADIEFDFDSAKIDDLFTLDTYFVFQKYDFKKFLDKFDFQEI